MPDTFDWSSHAYRVGPSAFSSDAVPADDTIERHRRNIEPWLAAIFQSEHLTLLLGSGFTIATAALAGARAVAMRPVTVRSELWDRIADHAQRTAVLNGRREPNIEDQIRSATALIAGLEVLQDRRSNELRTQLDAMLTDFLGQILDTERGIKTGFAGDAGDEAKAYMISFLLSFASRSASRERLSLFTTNYDRLIEYACDLVGLRALDRFVGALTPVFRSSRLDVDLHYNPPGIRGEPRYLEGVIRFGKLHGSVDWHFDAGTLRRRPVPFGAERGHPDIPATPVNTVMIYPNPAKDVETLEYPYAELFRDFSASISRPNSVLVTYGYGFGDDHINRMIADMLTIPSTHLVVISHSDAAGRIPAFCAAVGREAQVSLLIGAHFGELRQIVDHYLPKAAIDQITWRKEELLKRRGEGYRGHGTGEAPAPNDGPPPTQP